MKHFDRKAAALISLAWLAYLFSYLGRSDYSACMLEIVNQTGASKVTAGMVSSAFSICNAVGQLVSGWIMTKVFPVKVIGVELFSVAVINLLFPFGDSFVIMAVLWGINGFMQSTLLCGITQIFVRTLKEPYLSNGTVLLNTIGAIGGMFNYVISWLLIRYFRWEAAFFTAAALLFAVGIAWCVFMPKLAQPNADVRAPRIGSRSKHISLGTILKSSGVPYAILGGLFVGLLRESVSLWVPSYMNDVLGLDRSVSVLVTAVIPCLQICGAFLAGYLGHKTKNGLFSLSSAAFLCSGICLLSIRLFGNISTAASLIFFIANAICMTAALTFLVSLYPIRYFQKDTVAILVGVINFSVHFGDFVSSSGIGWISQRFGWNVTFIVLSVSAFTAAIICLRGTILNKKAVA